MSETKGTVRVADTRVATVQIVLPVHANHHGTTFGGQVSLNTLKRDVILEFFFVCTVQLFCIDV